MDETNATTEPTTPKEPKRGGKPVKLSKEELKTQLMARLEVAKMEQDQAKKDRADAEATVRLRGKEIAELQQQLITLLT